MRAVIFDLYETLVTEYEPNWRDHSIAGALGISEEACRRAWKTLHTARMIGEIADFPSALREMCKLSGVRPEEQVIQRLHRERVEIKSRPFREVDVGVASMLRGLHSKGIRLGLITNCSSEEVVAWEGSVFSELISEPVFSFQVGCKKPDRDIYQIACHRLGVEPEQAVFVGDGGSNELEGAKAVGLRVVWATWFLDRWPEWRIKHVEEVSSKFRRCGHASQLPDIAAGLFE